MQKASCFHRSTVFTETATSIPPLLFRSFCDPDNADAAAVLGSGPDIGTAIAVGPGTLPPFAPALVFDLEDDEDDDDDSDDNKLWVGCCGSLIPFSTPIITDTGKERMDGKDVSLLTAVLASRRL